MRILVSCLILFGVLAGCKDNSMEEVVIQGHRGCRGLLPENSIPAFKKAIDLDVSTLEMDVVITADHQVLVSHEPFFNPEICTHPDGSLISEGEAEALNIYGMRLDSVQQYPCGNIAHPRFPDQKSAEYHKPELGQLLSELKAYCEKNNKELPALNIEAKSVESLYGSHQPYPEEFAQLLLSKLEELNWEASISLQSFDMNMLKALKKHSPNAQLVCLNEDKEVSLDHLITVLEFTPDVYSPAFEMVDESLVKDCHERGITLSVWTVNEASDIEKVLDLGVRDIITDYPDRAIEICDKRAFSIR